MLLVAGFQPDRLPNAPDGTVPALLAVRDLGKGGVRVAIGLARGQGHANLHLVLARDIVPEDELEGQIAALMRADQPPIKADFRAVADRPEKQDNLLPVPVLRDHDALTIDGRATLMPEIAEERLPGSGNLRDAPSLAAFHPEIPIAIQVQRDAHAVGSLVRGNSKRGIGSWEHRRAFKREVQVRAFSPSDDGRTSPFIQFAILWKTLRRLTSHRRPQHRVR
jgi:hypothetical protein